MAIDIDLDPDTSYEDVWGKITKDPYIYAAFRSIGGHGICAVVQVSNPDSHKDHFRWCEEHFRKSGRIHIDPSCKNVSRARFVSYDTNLYTNINARPVGKTTEKKTTNHPKPQLPTTSTQIGRICQEIGANGINLAEDYHDWVAIGMSLANDLQEQGRQYFHVLSAISSKYDPQKTDKEYTGFLHRANGQSSIGTLFHYAKQAGIELYTQEERQAYAIAKTAKKSKSDIQSTIKAAEQAGLSTQMAQEVAERVFNDNLEISEDKESTIYEIASFIKLNTSLEFNTITRRIENGGQPINDRFVNSIYVKAKRIIGDKVTKTDVNAIIESDVIPDYCPIQRYIDSLQHLPHKPEIIDQLLDTIPYAVPEAREFVRHWLLGIPAVYHGEPVRIVLVLCGKQQTGKTQWFDRLFKPTTLYPYFSKNNLMNDLEANMIMSSFLVNLDDEFGGKSKKDAVKFKELTSKTKLTYRQPYGRTIVDLPRLCLLCGTSNDTEILNDSTGNTRILPVEMQEQYNFDLFNSIDKDQLFVELFRAYARGESWELSPNATATLNRLTMSHSVADMAAELVDLYLEEAPHLDHYFKSTTEIKSVIEKLSQQRIAINKLGEVLKNNYGSHIKKINGKTKRGYFVVWKNEAQNQDSPPF